MKTHSVSFCTICMNRLHTLQKTMPYNLDQYKDVPSANFFLLDYNSSDGLEQWVKSNLITYIEEKKLFFYKLIDPKTEVFSHSHSRNIIFRLANKSIICNVNADYFVQPDLMDVVNRELTPGNSSFLTLHPRTAQRDNYGRICVWKKDFLKIRGFDEKFNGYGYEDFDFYNRLKLSGSTEKHISSDTSPEYVEHTDTDRIKNMPDTKEVQSVYVEYINYKYSNLLFLKKDETLEFGTVILDNEQYGYEHVPAILQKKWINGTWASTPRNINITFSDGLFLPLDRLNTIKDECLKHKKRIFYKVTDTDLFMRCLLKKMIIHNYQLMSNNLTNKRSVVNPNSFGQSTVKENFTKRISLT